MTAALRFDPIRLPFISYVFHLRETGGRLSLDGGEVESFSECKPDELAAITAKLRPMGYGGRMDGDSLQIRLEGNR